MASVSGVPDVSRRWAWTLAALAPAVVLEAFGRGSAWLAALCAATALAVAFAMPAGRTGHSMAARFFANIDVAVIAVLVFLLLPRDGNLLFAGAATVLSILLARNLFGGLGQNLFHPAMLALAVLGLQATSSPAPMPFSEWTWIACWLGGIALLTRGVLSWRAPIAFLAGALLAAIASPSAAAGFAGSTAVLSDPALVICAFFVAGDPVTGCILPRARLAHGFLAGALVVLFVNWNPAAGLPLAMLLLNFIAPWLDQVLATPRNKALAR